MISCKRIVTVAGLLAVSTSTGAQADSLRQRFVSPPAASRPWVYWFFMDGNESRDGMRADLEAMHRAGIGGVIRMDVNIGVPKGPVAYMSPEWRADFAYGVQEAKRLGLQFSMETGPGWCGDGGPWIKPAESMQHLVSSETTVTGPSRFDEVLPRPQPRPPFFGEGTMTPELRQQWLEYYKDEYVVAFPTPAGSARVDDIDNKAFYYRGSASSGQAQSQIDAPTTALPAPVDACILPGKVVELTSKLAADGRLTWDVPPGRWTIMRFGRTTTGQTTRPAPDAGLGFESDKFDTAGIDAQFDAYTSPLLRSVGASAYGGDTGLTMLHFDSWEVSSQNWSTQFSQQFVQRRGYDPTSYLPVLTGHIVGSRQMSERFLWDLRETASELIVDVHGGMLADYAHRHGLTLSIEPYDLNPSADMDLGAVADLPMCEFWSTHYSAPTNYSCIEAVSIAHTNGRKVIGAEAFTAGGGQDWHKYPGSMKEQLDWALCTGINKFVIHRSQHQPVVAPGRTAPFPNNGVTGLRSSLPGMMMGPYGVNWERTETWWDMAPAFHQYIARCSDMLRQGLPVADILYVTPEGAPQVFIPPADALTTSLDADLLPDRRGYNFDGCSPKNLIAHATVVNGRVVFPDGMSYRILVLPEWDTMTPSLLRKIAQLVDAGAVVIGSPPSASPSLSNYPRCDAEVNALVRKLWGAAPYQASRKLGKGTVLLDVDKSTGALPFRYARWIWFDQGNPAQATPPGTRYFEKRIEIPAGCVVKSAKVAMTADNSFELFVNGHDVGGAHDWRSITTLDIKPWLHTADNNIRVNAVNDPGEGGGGDNPAGLIGAVDIHYTDGTHQTVTTGDGWSASRESTGSFSPAQVLGPFDMGPWTLQHRTTVFPPYMSTAAHLRALGVAQDFTAGNLTPTLSLERRGSEEPVRYIHRHLPDGELYFIANKSARSIETTCSFRVTGCRPEWWDPITGDSRDLDEYTMAGGVTAIPMRLGPLESGFVVFRRPTDKPSTHRPNFARYHPVLTLTKPWGVAFDPAWGGPAHVIFDTLDDWSRRPEPGVRYYSGHATYSTTFDLPVSTIGKALSISLGDVKNLATVRLNGRLLGTVWCDPWRVDVPSGVLRSTGNRLEVTVANLWVNRLIGDSGQPEAERLTSVTYNNYHPDSPLEPSGLLGPVRVEAEEGSRE